MVVTSRQSHYTKDRGIFSFFIKGVKDKATYSKYSLFLYESTTFSAKFINQTFD
ncbi:hypothetical protein B4102_2453 [Heyndrickxia sporothermodurans]|uniref:Uncharacterized protein n=1 Tax=Heyndrickxia sporothermodurans TaxID=46224 RepID=A0A150LC80_9BACI|nr:hypothetical protein B4102_2453 [Heyndrickxia sporothermodurans]